MHWQDEQSRKCLVLEDNCLSKDLLDFADMSECVHVGEFVCSLCEWSTFRLWKILE